MRSVELRLRWSEVPDAATAAWFLPGGDPEEWLRILVACGVAEPALKLYPVPASRTDPRPLGALVPLPAGAHPRTDSRAQPWQLRGRRLYLPADSRLDPPVDDAELEFLLPGGVVVLHPAAGLVCFELADGMELHRLLQAPPRREADWDRARPGVAVPGRLLSAEPAEPASLKIVLEQARGDIGSQGPRELPPTPAEQDEGMLDRLGRWADAGLSRAASWLGSPSPASGSGAGWLDRLREWLAHPSARPGRDLDAARNREILRLMHLLESDPDRGLRFALPLKGQGGRGVAKPGDRLTPRDVSFDLSRLKGGRAGDSWTVPWQVHEQLRARYRDLANRELALGRHLRAAYILAELLGDFPAAAAALVGGRHFREAAVILRDHLHRPLEAASCLEQGGLLGEAAAMYQEHGQWECAGDLLARLDRRDEAVALWRKAVERHITAGEILAAVRLLEERIGVPDEALDLLASGWPWSDQAGLCLRERFALLGRCARHDEARFLAVVLGRDPAPPGRVLSLAQALGVAAVSYPDEAVRRRCADAARIVAGRALAHATQSESTELVQVIARLAPEDRLLGRDGNRFLARRRAQWAPRPRPRSEGKDPVLVRQFDLPREVAWQSAAAQGRVFFAAGTVAGGLVIVRGLWDGSLLQQLRWEVAVPSQSRIRLEPGTSRTQPTLVAVPRGPRLEMLCFEATETLPVSTRVGTPPGLPDRLLSLAYGEQSLVWVLAADEEGRLALTAHTLDGSLVTTRAVPGTFEGAGPGPAPTCAALLVRRDSAFLAIGNRVVTLVRGDQFQSCEVQDVVLDLTGSDPLSRPRIAATFEWGAAVLWGGLDWGNVRGVAERLYRPLAAFTRDGTLVVMAQGEGQIYSTHNLAVLHRHTFAAPENVPLALLPASGLSEFGLFGTDGTVRVYRAPSL